MINTDSEKAVRNSELRLDGGSRLRLPLYQSYCFSNIPVLINNILLPDLTPLSLQLANCLPNKASSKPSRVLFNLIDSFGWRFFEEYQDDIPVLRTLKDEGLCSLFTSQFPSTTTAHVTTMNTGTSVGDHGLYEWFMYEPGLDQIVCPLLYSEADPLQRGSLYDKLNISPESFLPMQKPTFYEELAQSGVSSLIVAPAAYAPSYYDNAMTRGAKTVRYNGLLHSFDILKSILESPEQASPQYIYFYYGEIDSIAHEYGPLSVQHLDACKLFFNTFEKVLLPTILKQDNLTTILTADHGQKRIDPDKCLYINETGFRFESAISRMRTNNNLITPIGSPVDYFLHLAPENKEENISELREILACTADILSIQECLNLNLFGPVVSETFLSRLGCIVILSREDKAVWWKKKPTEGRTDKSVQKGSHGGLSTDEMEIPLIVI